MEQETLKQIIIILTTNPPFPLLKKVEQKNHFYTFSHLKRPLFYKQKNLSCKICSKNNTLSSFVNNPNNILNLLLFEKL